LIETRFFCFDFSVPFSFFLFPFFFAIFLPEMWLGRRHERLQPRRSPVQRQRSGDRRGLERRPGIVPRLSLTDYVSLSAFKILVAVQNPGDSRVRLTAYKSLVLAFLRSRPCRFPRHCYLPVRISPWIFRFFPPQILTPGRARKGARNAGVFSSEPQRFSSEPYPF